MKVLLVGLGSFGAGWYARIKRDHSGLQIAVVDRDPARAAHVAGPDGFHTDLGEAIAREQPDFVLNATPPGVHDAVNHTAFDHRLPVLCEKPIADDYEDAVRIVARADEEGIPFMIAENYRRAPNMRAARQLIAGGAIGELSAMHCHVFQPYRTTKPYFLQMRHPFLVDVAVHHLDLMRYLAGAEGRRIVAHSYRPPGSWHAGNLALSLSLEMDSGVQATLVGNLLTEGTPTGWPGRWRIEGSAGAIEIEDGAVCMVQAGHTSQTPNEWLRQNQAQYCHSEERSDEGIPEGGKGEAEARGPLDDFLRLLSGSTDVETQGSDYIRTQALVHYAQQSSESGRALEVQLPRGYAIGTFRGHDLFRATRYQGAIVRDHHILLIRHQLLHQDRSYWVLPGGGRELRESGEACVRREMREETHLDVRVERLLLDEVGHPEGMYQRRRTYLCRPIGGRAQPGSEPEEDAAAFYAIAEVAWLDLRDESDWPALLVADPITYPQMHSVRAALGYT